VAVISYFYTI